MTLTAPQARADVVSPSTAPPLRVLTYNICGSGGTAGCDVTANGNTNRYNAIVNEASATGWNADQIFLVEICKYQFDALDQRLPASYVGHYASTLRPTAAGLCVNPANANDSGNGDYGMALFVRGTKVDDSILTLHTPGQLPPDEHGAPQTEAIKAPCLKTYVQNRLNWACAVHLFWGSPAGQHMSEEARKLTDQTRQWESEGIPVVLGGDFNANPLTAPLSYFYDTSINNNATGTFIEADETDSDHFGTNTTVDCTLGRDRCRTGETTFIGSDGVRKKLDFLFFSSRFFSGAVGDAFTEVRSISDHGRYRGAAYWADCRHPYDAAPGSVFRRDATGNLYRYDGTPSGDTAALAKPCKVGYGWQGMTHVARQGTALIAVDPAGTLWHYPAAATDGSYSGSTRKQAGTGFQGDNLLLTPGDFDGDGTADLITRDTTGALWLHKGTDEHSYAPRTRIVDTSGDWFWYSSAIAGNFAHAAGAPRGTTDLIAVDEVGNLWLQEGNGDGTLGERRLIGTGWGIYDTLAAPGDLNGDGNPDMVGREDGGDLYFYKGDGAGGYAPRVKVGSSFPAGEMLF
ncbi:endonuclease/exonuclease/phosphatase family protein [Streptomyces sp. NPDC001930]|uniref:endonuclease/exonuclease/phosphatase family protein n=1 Tax=Streptomyces sp. NPDC001930 TaxID=3364625 RepID=UPI0036B4B7D7